MFVLLVITLLLTVLTGERRESALDESLAVGNDNIENTMLGHQNQNVGAKE